MFAFGIWDGNKKELFLVRDRIGIKPLYYTSYNGQFIFASEIKAILEHPDVKREVDEDAFYDYLSFLTTPAPKTLFKGIRKLPPGYSLTVDENGNANLREYWDVFDNVIPLNGESESFCTESIIEILKESVKYRMVSDVPVGIFLSGGVDSSINTAFFSEFSDELVKTFSIGFKGQESYNEFQYARKVSRLFDTDHHETIMNVDDLVDFLPKLIFHQDEPIADSVCVPLYFVSKLARDNGVIVCQAGEGSDELFCGYQSWKSVLRLNSSLPYIHMIPSFFRSLGLKSLEIAGKGNTEKYEKLRRAHLNESIFWGGAEGIGESEKRLLLSRNLREKYAGKSSHEVIESSYKRFLERSPMHDYLSFMSYLDLKLRLPELLLMRIDRMSMATSLEARVPFLDHKFVELAMSIPQSIKFRNHELKYILKKSVDSIIPNDIIHRKKQGFQVPVTEWFFERLGDFAEQRLLGFTKRTDFLNEQYVKELLTRRNGSKLWYLLNFVLWHERWIENIQ